LKINSFCAENNENKHIFLRKTPQKIADTRAALFVHQIVCRLGLCPRTHWGSSQRFPEHLAVFRGPVYTSRGGKKGEVVRQRRG